MTNNLIKSKAKSHQQSLLFTRWGDSIYSRTVFTLIVIHGIKLYLRVYFFVCLHRNPSRSPFHLQGGRWDNPFHSRTLFELNRLFLAVFSRMEASNIQVFLFRQRIFKGHGWKEDLFRFLLVYNSFEFQIPN